MPDTLIICAHPDIGHSTVHQRWLTELRHWPERFTVHEIYSAHPDGTLDVIAEQRNVEAHRTLVLQFPIHWFNCPPLLKKWLDAVLTHGWAYGKSGKALAGRTTALAVSFGIPAADYRHEGKIGYCIADVLRPFELTMKYCNADYRPPFTFHTIDSNASYDAAARAAIERSATDYLNWLNGLSNTPCNSKRP